MIEECLTACLRKCSILQHYVIPCEKRLIGANIILQHLWDVNYLKTQPRAFPTCCRRLLGIQPAEYLVELPRSQGAGRNELQPRRADTPFLSFLPLSSAFIHRCSLNPVVLCVLLSEHNNSLQLLSEYTQKLQCCTFLSIHPHIYISFSCKSNLCDLVMCEPDADHLRCVHTATARFPMTRHKVVECMRGIM